jgi:hypothetical protein
LDEEEKKRRESGYPSLDFLASPYSDNRTDKAEYAINSNKRRARAAQARECPLSSY